MTKPYLSKKLEDIINSRIVAMIPRIMEWKAKALRNRVKTVAKVWRADVFEWMDESPAPGMPTRRTGELVKSLHYTTERLRKTKNGGYIIEVSSYWNPTVSKSSGEDYGSIINYTTRVQGYRDRVNKELRDAVERIIRI